MAAQNLPLKEVKILQVQTPAGDLLFYERAEAGPYRNGKEVPAMGSDHPQKAKWPNHKLCGIIEDGEDGWLRMYYMASRAAQEAYNWEHAELLENENPTVRQTWVVKRASYAPGSIAAPPSLGGRTWTFMGGRQRRSDPTTDGLFVILEHEWQDISSEREGVELDAETGEVRAFSRQIVAAGTAGQSANSDGQYKEVMPINRLWSMRTTRQLAGLGGAASKSRTYTAWEPWPWPGVLSTIFTGPVPGADGGIAKVIWRPVWKRKAYNGPCRVQITEEWSLTAPTVNAENQLQVEGIDYDGAMLSINVEPCLHPLIRIQEGTSVATDRFAPYSYTAEYPATNYTDWPATLVGLIRVTRSNGGFLKRTMLVDRPTTGTDPAAITLVLGDLGSETAEISWSSAIPTPDYRLDVCRNPLFAYDFVTGFKNLDVNAATSYTITGLERGVAYFVRVRAGSVISNIVAVVLPQAPMIEVYDVETTLRIDNGDTVTLPSVDPASTSTYEITITNSGEINLEIETVAITGTDAAQFSSDLTPQTLAPGAEVVVTLTFDPSSAGTKTASLAIGSDSPDDGAFVIPLTATAGYPEIQVESPPGTPVADGGNVVITYATSATATVRVKNVGELPLTSLAFTFNLDPNPEYWNVTPGTFPGSTLAAGDYYDLVFTLIDSGPLTNVSQELTIASNDANENPYNVTMTGILPP